MLERWLGNKALDSEIEPLKGDAFHVDLDWLLDFDFVENKYKDLQENALNEAGKQLLADRLKANGISSGSFDFTTAGPSEIRSSYCNSRLIEPSPLPLNKYGNYPSGVFAAMGNFNFYALPSGSIRDAGGRRYEITVDKMAIVALDSFQFQGWEVLGYWSYIDRNFSYVGIGTYNSLSNDRFRELRAKTGIGEDFAVESDKGMVAVSEETKFLVDSNFNVIDE